ncbi:AlkA N-terminal domain-containing protein [Demequina aurantiaca]|uniref:AlkA N-terminal domain-containing protein n=1 Tax=Demequina aurantiaca TaxID=676200 RepID=UPI0007852D18|nr:AlkA N-terminal domain-containing protein [Demequina aurantiaca]
MTTAPLDFDTCYSAVASLDKRFDGQFITAVRSTGIYCRPSCPARTPKPSNCTFYRTSAAAHAAGYRACKRCLPEAVPGSSEWNMREDVAARAMRLITDGTVDREGVTGLASRLGYSERQLGRILTEELGAGPLQLARAQRAQSARQLLVSTPMQASEVAFAAGFASIRQFNDTIGEVFGMTPTELRGRARLSEQPTTRNVRTLDRPRAGAIALKLRTREPFNGVDVLRWLERRAVAGLELVEHGDNGDHDIAYTRTVRLARGAAVMTVRVEAGAVLLTASLEHLDDLPSLISRTRRLFDLDADPLAIDEALARDPRLAPSIAAHPGTRIPGSMGATEMAVRAIVGQQVSVAAARTATERLVATVGEPLPPALDSLGVDTLFPAADALAESAVDVLTGQLARRETVARLARHIAAGSLPLDVSQTRADLTGALEALRGIGPWTSNYLALRLLGSPDVLLTGDSAVRAGAAALGLPSKPTDLADSVAAFAPWRSYLMTHLWRAASLQRKDS